MPPPSKLPKITSIDYSITVEVKQKTTMWIKIGATAVVPEGGNPTREQKSLAAWVEKLAQDKVEEMLS